MKKKSKLIERFEEKIFYSPDGCWLWIAGIAPNGYASFNGGVGGSGHRFSYTFFKGQIPKGLSVCHTCDVRNCVNPDHLFLGTTKDNLNDMQRKGRKVVVKGTQCAQAKLTEADVIKIKGLLSIGLMPTLINRCTGIHWSTVSLIRRGIIWKSVDAPEICGTNRKGWSKIINYRDYNDYKRHKRRLKDLKLKRRQDVLFNPLPI